MPEPESTSQDGPPSGKSQTAPKIKFEHLLVAKAGPDLLKEGWSEV